MTSSDLSTVILSPQSSSIIFDGICNYYSPIAATLTYTRTLGIGCANTGALYVYDSTYNAPTTEPSDYTTWLTNNNVTLYYVLATPTNTQIIDSTLISQLNAIDSAVLPNPIAYINVGSTGTNLPGALKISYYGEEE